MSAAIQRVSPIRQNRPPIPRRSTNRGSPGDHQVPVLRMSIDVFGDVPTGGYDTQLSCPQVVQSTGHDQRSDSPPSECRIRKRVVHHDPAGHRLILGGTHHLAVDHGFVTVPIGRVANGHVLWSAVLRHDVHDSLPDTDTNGSRVPSTSLVCDSRPSADGLTGASSRAHLQGFSTKSVPGP